MKRRSVILTILAASACTGALFVPSVRDHLVVEKAPGGEVLITPGDEVPTIDRRDGRDLVVTWEATKIKGPLAPLEKPPVDPAPTLNDSVFGVNANFPNPYISAFPFSNRMRNAQWWMRADKTLATVDDRGFPLEAASTQVVSGGFDYKTHAGDWTLVYEPVTANVVLQGGGSRQVEATPGRKVYSVPGSGGLTVKTDGVLTKCELWLPGSEGTLVNEDYAEDLREAGCGVFRMMDLIRLAEHGIIEQGGKKGWIADWAKRPKMDDCRWGTNAGVPWEAIFLLSNEIRCKYLWVTLPHLADQTYVRGVAALARDTLAPGVVVVLEWSNEIWNTGFTQGNYYKRIDTRKPGIPAGKDAAQAFEWWLAEWPDPTRVFPVVMGHQATPQFVRDMLPEANKNGRVRGVGCAQYAKPSKATVEGWLVDAVKGGECPNCPTSDEVVDAVIANLQQTLDGLAAHKLIAAEHRLALCIYEWGPSLYGMYYPYADAYAQADALQEMADGVVAPLAQAQVEAGVFLSCFYAFRQAPSGRDGTWALSYGPGQFGAKWRVWQAAVAAQRR